MLIIFDWDGTLIDSAGKIVRCMQQSASDLALPSLTDDAVKNIIGLGLPEAIHQLFPDVDEKTRTDFATLYGKHFVEADQTPCPFFPGVMDTLEQLKSSGHTLAVATGKSRRGMNRVLGNLQMEDFFHDTRCADETQSKPHPQMLHELLDVLVHAPKQSVLVGDTCYDLEMAQRAKVASVGVSYGAHEVSRLQAFDPIAVVDEFSHLLSIIENY